MFTVRYDMAHELFFSIEPVNSIGPIKTDPPIFPSLVTGDPTHNRNKPRQVSGLKTRPLLATQLSLGTVSSS